MVLLSTCSALFPGILSTPCLSVTAVFSGFTPITNADVSYCSLLPYDFYPIDPQLDINYINFFSSNLLFSLLSIFFLIYDLYFILHGQLAYDLKPYD